MVYDPLPSRPVPIGWMPKCCSACGSPLVRYKRRTGRFDQDTGERIVEERLDCAKLRRHWVLRALAVSFISFDFHDRYVVHGEGLLQLF